jgi:hypothetical protein
MTRTKSSRALLSVVLAVLMVAAFMPALTYSSFAATAKKATKVTKLTHTGAKVSAKVGNKYVLKYKLSPSKLTSAAKKTVWKSSDSSIVKVYSTKSNRAAVKAKAEGTAKVTVYTKANKKAKATWTFKVTKKAETKTTLTGVTVSALNAADPAKEVKVGTELQASVAPTDAKDVTYQWYAGDTAISGATSAKYTVTTAEIGKTITVKATSKNDVTSTATAKVATPTLDTVTVANQTNKATGAAPAIGDVLKATAKAKSTLTGQSTPTTYETSDVTYQWYRDSATAANAISGATSQTYTVAAADAGHTLLVVATPKTGVSGYPVQSAVTGTVKAAAKTATLTATTNGSKVSATVKDSKGTDITATGKFDFQWAESKDGTTFTAIANSNSQELTNGNSQELTNGLMNGYTYKVTVTPKSDSEYTLAQTTATVKFTGKSLETAAANASVFNITANVRGDAQSATPKVGDELQVKADGLTYGTDYTVTWYRSDKDNSADKAFNPVTAQNLGTSQSYKLTSSDVAGTYLYAVVTGAGDYAGQTKTLAYSGNVNAATSTYTLSYDATNKTLVVKDANGNPVKSTDYTTYAYKNGTTTATAQDFTSAAAAEGYTFFVTDKNSSVKSNGITFVSGQDPASVTVSGLVTIA